MVDQMLWDRVTREARRDDVSISEFIRTALAGAVDVPVVSVPKAKRAA